MLSARGRAPKTRTPVVQPPLQQVQDLGTEEAVRHFDDIAQLHQRVQVAESAAALDSGRRR